MTIYFKKLSFINSFPVSLFAMSILFIAIFTISGCDNDSRRWEKAAKQDTFDSYESYINEYPEGKYVTQAKDNIKIITTKESWDRAIKENSIDSYYGFLQKYPESDKAKDAVSSINKLAIAAAHKEANAGLLTPDQIMMFAESGVSSEETTAEQKQEILNVLIKAIMLLPKEQRISFPEIQPDLTGNPVVVSNTDKGNSQKGIASSFQITGSDELADVYSVGGMITPPDSDGDISNALLATKGDSVVTDPSKHRKNVTSHCTIRIQNFSNTPCFVIYTDLPQEIVPYSLGSDGLMSGPEVVVPNGENSLFRFKGEIVNFFPGWTIKSDTEEPICFLLLKDDGLTYVFGRGTVTDTKGKKYDLPVRRKIS